MTRNCFPVSIAGSNVNASVVMLGPVTVNLPSPLSSTMQKLQLPGLVNEAAAPFTSRLKFDDEPVESMRLNVTEPQPCWKVTKRSSNEGTPLRVASPPP